MHISRDCKQLPDQFVHLWQGRQGSVMGDKSLDRDYKKDNWGNICQDVRWSSHILERVVASMMNIDKGGPCKRTIIKKLISLLDPDRLIQEQQSQSQ